MVMSHKAYAFDWNSFERDELHGILLTALSSGGIATLIGYIDANLDKLKSPYEGDPLSDHWRDALENLDVHEYGDFALTRFYDPTQEWGLGDQWRSIDVRLPQADQAALLGTPFGTPDARFDPGRQGSYFQTPEKVKESLARMQRFELPNLKECTRSALQTFEELMGDCVAVRSGLYITF